MAGAADVHVYPQRLDPGVAELCWSPWSCTVSGALAELWLSAMVGAAVFGLFLVLVHLQRARGLLKTERKRSELERAAFESFTRRVSEVRPGAAASPPPIPGGPATSAAFETTRRPLDEVEAAYRETVMAVPHYEEEYDERLVENMTVEFGRDVAEAVSSSTDLSALLQGVLTSKATQSAGERTQLIRSLDREADSLGAAASALRAVESALDDAESSAGEPTLFAELPNRWDRLDALEARVTDALRSRQEGIHDLPMNHLVRVEGPSLQEYLYQPMPVDYPALADGGLLLDRIQRRRRAVMRDVYTRT